MPRVASLAWPALLALGGCGAARRKPVGPRLDVVPSRPRVIQRRQVERSRSSTGVSGRGSRRSLVLDPVWGQIHLGAWGSRGLLGARDTIWSPLGKRRVPTSPVSADLSGSPAEVEEIRISHVAGSRRHLCNTGTSQ